MAEMTIIYGVRLRKTKSRLVVEIVRDSYIKQLCYFQQTRQDEAQKPSFVYASKKPRYFLDAEDETYIRRECSGILHDEGRRELREERIGSVELGLYLFKGPRIEVRYVGGEVFGTWEPDTGLRLTKDAHPALAGDKKHIAKVCAELPHGGGGIFQGEPEEPTL